MGVTISGMTGAGSIRHNNRSFSAANVDRSRTEQKNAFLVQAILESEEKEAFESTLRRVLWEELQAVPSQSVKQPEEAIPQEIMGFLGSLLGEE